MKYLATLIMAWVTLPAAGQYNPRRYHEFDGVKTLAYANDTSRHATVKLNISDSCAKGYIIGGVVHLLNSCKEPIYTTADLPVLFRGNFEIVVVAKIVCGETFEQLRDGFISWAVDSVSNTYNTFVFTNDKYYAFHSRNGATGATYHKNYSKRDIYYYSEFARYTIRKYNDKYYFFINGRLIGTAPYMEADGTLFELGASPKAYAQFKSVAVFYLP